MDNDTLDAILTSESVQKRFGDIKTKYDLGIVSQELALERLESGKTVHNERACMYDNELVPDYVALRRLDRGDADHLEIGLIYESGFVSQDLAEERLKTGKAKGKEVKTIYHRNLISKELALERLESGVVNSSEISLIYYRGFVSQKLALERLNSGQISNPEIKKIYNSGFVDQDMAAERRKYANEYELNLINNPNLISIGGFNQDVARKVFKKHFSDTMRAIRLIESLGERELDFLYKSGLVSRDISFARDPRKVKPVEVGFMEREGIVTSDDAAYLRRVLPLCASAENNNSSYQQ